MRDVEVVSRDASFGDEAVLYYRVTSVDKGEGKKRKETNEEVKIVAHRCLRLKLVSGRRRRTGRANVPHHST